MWSLHKIYIWGWVYRISFTQQSCSQMLKWKRMDRLRFSKKDDFASLSPISQWSSFPSLCHLGCSLPSKWSIVRIRLWCYGNCSIVTELSAEKYDGQLERAAQTCKGQRSSLEEEKKKSCLAMHGSHLSRTIHNSGRISGSCIPPLPAAKKKKSWRAAIDLLWVY